MKLVQFFELIVKAKNLLLKYLKNFSFKKTFSINNFVKLLFVYLFGITTVIVVNFDFSENFWRKLLSNKLSKQKIAFYTVERIGEKMIYDRLKIVAKAKNIDFCGAVFDEPLAHFWLTKHFYLTASSLLNYLYKPQFNLAITHHVNIIPWGYNITYLNIPRNDLYDVYGNFKNKWQHLTDYDAYADLYSFVHGNNDLLEAIIYKQGRALEKIMPVYIAQNYVPYSAVESFDKAIITGSLWGCTRESLRMMRGMKKLSEDGFLVSYGMKNYLGFMGAAYMGSLENFGNSIDSVISVQKKHGIALVVHNLEHMLEAMPTNRISEAAVSGALIISDNHPLIQKLFKDNVLYFDSLADNEQIYQQIKTHIEWARANPQLAAKKAEASYQIFTEYLQMEQQLDALFAQISRSTERSLNSN